MMRWMSLYPTIDIKSELQRAVDWMAKNPVKRVDEFIERWLQRSVEFQLEKSK
jgi:hypothetical protein